MIGFILVCVLLGAIGLFWAWVAVSEGGWIGVVAVVVVAGGLWWAADASAAPMSLATPVVMLGDEKPAPLAFVQVVQGPARAFWADRGVTNCPDGLVVYQSTNASRYGWGAGAACRVWISDDLAGVLDQDRFGRSEMIDACQALTHETGHALGLGHTPTGVMSASLAAPEPHAWAPWFCRGWATRMVKRLLRERDAVE